MSKKSSPSTHIPHFKDFGKTANNLLTLGYPAIKEDPDFNEYVESSAGISVATAPRDDFSLKSGITNTVGNGKEATDAKFETSNQVGDIVSVDGTYRTKGVLSFDAKFDKVIPVDGLKVSLGLNAEKKKQYGCIAASFCHEFFHAHACVDVPISTPLFDWVDAAEIASNKPKIDAHVTTGLKEQNVYVSGGVEATKVEESYHVDKYSVTGMFQDGDFATTLGYTQEFQQTATGAKPSGRDARTVSATFTSKVTSDVTVAVGVDHEINASDTVGTIGFGYPLNSDANVGLKYDTKKRAGFNYSHKLSANSTLSTGALFEAAGSDIKSYYAFKLSLKQ